MYSWKWLFNICLLYQAIKQQEDKYHTCLVQPCLHCCYGLNGIPLKFICWSPNPPLTLHPNPSSPPPPPPHPPGLTCPPPPPPTSECDCLEIGPLKRWLSKRRPFGWVLIQSDWYKRRTFGHTKRHQGSTHTEEWHNEKEAIYKPGREATGETKHLDLRFTDSRTVNK